MTATPVREASVDLWSAFFEKAPTSGRGVLLPSESGLQKVPWSQIVKEAEAHADGLRARGVRDGDVVGAVMTNSPEAVAGLLGIWLAGAVVASLPVPARGMALPQYVEQLLELATRFEAPFVLSDASIAQALDAAASDDASRSVLGWGAVRGSGQRLGTPPGHDDLAFIQYSSGSTGMPKGCMLSSRAIAAQLDLILNMADGTPGEDTVMSWLPLSHDMGLFGCLLLACNNGSDFCMSSPERFVKSPRSWFADCAASGATLTAGPNSGLRLAARAARSRARHERLSLRVCVVGAEPVDLETIDQVVAAYADAGLHHEVFMPAYGMAEATLAATAIGVGERPDAVSIDAAALADGFVRLVEPGTAGATLVTSVGRPCEGVEVALAPGESGRLSEIRLRSPSLSTGYYGDDSLTAERFHDGELRTGDLGFLHDGELYVVGRLDDMISINGRNVYAGEIETAMARVDAIRNGCCTIIDVSVDGTARLVALAEVVDGHDDFEALAAEMSRVAAEAAGVRLDECLFLAKGELPKTPSGKTQRHRARTLAKASRSTMLAAVSL